jgi:short-subunit dehydrogenase
VANLVELPQGLPSKILRVNLLSCVKMIELIVPGMVRRNQGIVVNIASITVSANAKHIQASSI